MMKINNATGPNTSAIDEPEHPVAKALRAGPGQTCHDATAQRAKIGRSRRTAFRADTLRACNCGQRDSAGVQPHLAD